MRRIALLIMSLLLIGGVIMPLVSLNEAGAGSVSYNSEAALDGTVWYTESIGPPPIGFLTAVSNANTIVIGRWYHAGDMTINRGYLSFDTSSLPDTGEVLGATLNAKVSAVPGAGELSFNIEVENINYGAALDTADWGLTGPVEGTLLSSDLVAAEDWVSMPLTPENIDPTGRTQYRLISSRDAIYPTSETDEIVEIYSAETSNDPYISVEVLTFQGALLTYNFTQVGMTNRTETIYPAEIIDHNETAEIVRFEVFLTNETWAWFQVEPNYTYLSVHPSLNVTAIDPTNGTYNLTQRLLNFSWFHIWFIRDKPTLTTTVNIQLWHSTIGEGFFWEKWKVMVNAGTVYNPATAQRVPAPAYNVNRGGVYTLTVLDYFDNEITNYTFTSNQATIDALIPLDVYTFKVKNLRLDSSLLAVYFNAIGDPFTQMLVYEEVWAMPIREGSYMFVFSFLYTNSDNLTYYNGTSFFYNLTVDGDYTAYIGESIIQIVYTDVNNMTVDVDNIITWVTPNVVYIIDNPALCPTGMDGGSGEWYYLDPWITVRASVSVTDTGTGSLWAGELDTGALGGAITYFSDSLFISASNTSATVYVNETGGPEVFNTTAPAGLKFDILNDYYSNRGDNLTVEVDEGAFSITREIVFRWERLFNWYQLDPTHYQTGINVNNTLDLKFHNPQVSVAFANDTKPDLDSVRVRDLDNDILLSPGEGYRVDNTGVKFEFGNISAGESRAFSIEYWTENATYYGIEWIHPVDSPQWVYYNGQDRKYLYGSWQNNEGKVFLGEVRFVLGFDEGKDIDPSTVIVTNRGTGKEVPSTQWEFTGTTIDIDPDYIGDVVPSETVSIGVYYLKYPEAVTGILTEDVILGLSWPWIVALFGFTLIVLGVCLVLLIWIKRIGGKRVKAIKTSGYALLESGIGIVIADLLVVFIVILTGGA